jgi:hypothetical protein
MDVNTVHIEGEATPISLSKRRKLNKSPNSVRRLLTFPSRQRAPVLTICE